MKLWLVMVRDDDSTAYAEVEIDEALLATMGGDRAENVAREMRPYVDLLMGLTKEEVG